MFYINLRNMHVTAVLPSIAIGLALKIFFQKLNGSEQINNITETENFEQLPPFLPILSLPLPPSSILPLLLHSFSQFSFMPYLNC